MPLSGCEALTVCGCLRVSVGVGRCRTLLGERVRGCLGGRVGVCRGRVSKRRAPSYSSCPLVHTDQGVPCACFDGHNDLGPLGSSAKRARVATTCIDPPLGLHEGARALVGAVRWLQWWCFQRVVPCLPDALPRAQPAHGENRRAPGSQRRFVSCTASHEACRRWRAAAAAGMVVNVPCDHL